MGFQKSKVCIEKCKKYDENHIEDKKVFFKNDFYHYAISVHFEFELFVSSHMCYRHGP